MLGEVLGIRFMAHCVVKNEVRESGTRTCMEILSSLLVAIDLLFRESVKLCEFHVSNVKIIDKKQNN